MNVTLRAEVQYKPALANTSLAYAFRSESHASFAAFKLADVRGVSAAEKDERRGGVEFQSLVARIRESSLEDRLGGPCRFTNLAQCPRNVGPNPGTLLRIRDDGHKRCHGRRPHYNQRGKGTMPDGLPLQSLLGLGRKRRPEPFLVLRYADGTSRIDLAHQDRHKLLSLALGQRLQILERGGTRRVVLRQESLLQLWTA